jgi:S-formylglutathione hydrolase FrmB
MNEAARVSIGAAVLSAGVLLGTSGAHAQGVAIRERGQIIDELVHIPALEGNVLGDSADQRVVVYLPPSYKKQSQRRYPALYLLHGIGGSPEDWGPDGFQGMDISLVMDSLVRSGATREMIIVMPNGRNRYLGAFYLNSATNGGWEDYITRDLIRHVDTTYRTLRSAASRGIAGHSMGGFGAIMLATRRPDLFGAAYALSPCCLGMVGDLSASDSAWYRLAEYRNWDDLVERAGEKKDFMPIGYVALAAAISPNPRAVPWKANLPVVMRAGRLQRVAPTLDRWRATLPLSNVKTSRGALLRLKALALDVGVRDEFTHITLGTVLFSDSLAAYQVPHTLEVYEGDHRDRIRDRITTRVLPFFSRELSPVPAAYIHGR